MCAAQSGGARARTLVLAVRALLDLDGHVHLPAVGAIVINVIAVGRSVVRYTAKKFFPRLHHVLRRVLIVLRLPLEVFILRKGGGIQGK